MIKLLLFAAGLLLLVQLASSEVAGCPDYSEPNPPYARRQDAVMAFFQFCAGRKNVYTCSVDQAKAQWDKYMDPYFWPNYNYGVDFFSVCALNGNLQYQRCFGTCEFLPTSTQTGYVQLGVNNMLNGQVFNNA